MASFESDRGIGRRRFLRAAGTVGGIGLLSGCSDSGSSESSSVVAPDALLLHLTAASGFEDGSWTDESGNGNDASQDDPDRTPSVSSDAVNGRAALTFDGENDVLRSPLDISPATRPEITVFVVFRSNAAENARRKLYGNDNGGYDRVVGLDDRGNTNLTYFNGNEVASYTDIQADTWYVATQHYQDGRFSGWLDGEQTTDSAPTDYGESKSVLEIGSDGDDSYFWNGDISELRVYDETLTADQREQIQNNLLDRFGL